MVNSNKDVRINIVVDSNTAMFIEELSKALNKNKSFVMRLIIQFFRNKNEKIIWDLIEKNKNEIDDLDK